MSYVSEDTQNRDRAEHNLLDLRISKVNALKEEVNEAIYFEITFVIRPH